jgi:uncharacterized membrane protein YfcA
MSGRQRVGVIGASLLVSLYLLNQAYRLWRTDTPRVWVVALAVGSFAASAIGIYVSAHVDTSARGRVPQWVIMVVLLGLGAVAAFSRWWK